MAQFLKALEQILKWQDLQHETVSAGQKAASAVTFVLSMLRVKSYIIYVINYGTSWRSLLRCFGDDQPDPAPISSKEICNSIRLLQATTKPTKQLNGEIMSTLVVYSLDEVPFWFEKNPNLTISDLSRHLCPETNIGIFEQHCSTGIFHLLDSQVLVNYLLQDWEDFGLQNARLVVPIFAHSSDENTPTVCQQHLQLTDVRTERVELGTDMLETLSRIKHLTQLEPSSLVIDILPPKYNSQGLSCMLHL